MTDLNRVNFIGRIVKDTVLEETPKSKVSVARFSVAVNRDVKSEDGAYKPKVSFIDLAIFDNFAKKVSPYLKQGTLVAIEGYLEQQIWVKDNVTKSKLAVIVSKLQLLSAAKSKEQKNENKENVENHSELPDVSFSENDNESNYFDEIF